MACWSTATTRGPKSMCGGTRTCWPISGSIPTGSTREFIYDVFVKKVIVGQMSLLEALERTLPGLGYRGPAMAFVGYWLSHDSNVNEPVLDVVRRLQGGGRQPPVSRHQPGTHAGPVAVADAEVRRGVRGHVPLGAGRSRQAGKTLFRLGEQPARPAGREAAVLR